MEASAAGGDSCPEGWRSAARSGAAAAKGISPARRPASQLVACLLLLLATGCAGQGPAQGGDLQTDVVCTVLLRGRPGSTDGAPSVAEARVECSGPGTPITIDANPALVAVLGDTVPGVNLVPGSPLESYLAFKSQPPLTIRDSDVDDLFLNGFAPISVFNTTVQFLDSEFDRNSATEAGVVNAAGSTLRFRNCTFRANVGVKFGAIAVTGGESLTIVDGLFLGNRGGADGAIGLKSGAVKASRVAKVDITGTVFRGNVGLGEGASAFLGFQGVNATFSTVDFVMNSASNGSAVVMKGGRTDALGCVFGTNTGGSGGSGLQIEDNAQGRLLGCEFDENSGGTGALTVRNSSADVKACAFVHNRGGGMGGGVSAFDGVPGSPLSFSNCVFENNSAPLGGAVAISGAPVTLVEGCVFTANGAGSMGGGLYQRNCNASRVVGSTFENNTAGAVGGAVAQTSCAVEVGDPDGGASLDFDCAAMEGTGCDAVELSGNKFVRNVASLRGGAVFQRGCDDLALTSNTYAYDATEGNVLHQQKCVSLLEDNETYQAVGPGDGGDLGTAVVRKRCPL